MLQRITQQVLSRSSLINWLSWLITFKRNHWLYSCHLEPEHACKWWKCTVCYSLSNKHRNYCWKKNEPQGLQNKMANNVDCFFFYFIYATILSFHLLFKHVVCGVCGRRDTFTEGKTTLYYNNTKNDYKAGLIIIHIRMLRFLSYFFRSSRWRSTFQLVFCQCISARGSVRQHHRDAGALSRSCCASSHAALVPGHRRRELQRARDPPRAPQRHAPDLPLLSLQL